MTIDAAFMPLVAAAFETAGTLVAIFDLREDAPGTPTFAHIGSALLTLTGFAEAELAGRPFATILKPNEAAMAEMAADVIAGRPYRGDLACITKDGATKWLGLQLLPVPASARHCVMIGRDITAQRRANAQTRLVQGVLLKIFMSFERATAVITADDRIIMANASMEGLTGAAPGSLTGRTVASLVVPAYRQLMADVLGTQLDDSESAQLDVEIARAEAPPALVSARVVRIGGADMHGIAMLSLVPSAEGCVLPYHLRMAGKIRVVSLQAIQDELGDRWEKVAARVAEIAEHMIRRRLRPEDLLARTDDQGFTICFAGATEEEASSLAAAIAREIRQHLVGNGESEASVQVTAVVSRVAVPSAGSPDMAQIGRHMAQAERALQNAPRPEPRREPIFLAGDNAIAASFIRARAAPDAAGMQVFPESSVECATAALKIAAVQKPAHWLLVDVSFDTLTNRQSANAYLEACAALPQAVREHLYPVIGTLPRGTTQSLLQELTRRIGACAAGFGIRIDELHAPEFNMNTFRPAVAIVDMRRWENGASVPPERLARLTGMLHAFRVRVLAANVASFPVGRHLQGLGVNWIMLDR